MLPAVHAVVENNDIELGALKNRLDFIEQYRVRHEARGGEPGDESFFDKTLLRFGIIVAHDGIADEQNAREARFIRVGNPDVAPLNGFTGRRGGVRLSGSDTPRKSCGEAERQYPI